MTGTLRDRLRARQLPTAVVRLPADPAGYAAAEQYFDAATRALQLAQARQVPDLGPYEQAVKDATAAVEGQAVEVFTLRCLAPADWEALITEHPASDEQRKQGWQWDVVEFRPALLAEAVVAPEGEKALSESDWRFLAEQGQLTVGELDLLFATAVNLQTRQPQVSVGKGSAGTPS
ncbi:MAG: hypothetical protein EPO40_03100 [Myxococcaceae bacterium]|nr:MAG: hypothetical protein EPO40_03100 [Myxococcaceae bacterium]